MQRKGIILAGGTGSRLYPSSIVVSKQLMPVFDKPMIYYPISTFMDCNIREILVITTPHEQAAFKALLNDGAQWGLDITYAVQPKPEGIAQALIIAEEFLGGSPCALILGDNLFFGNAVVDAAQAADKKETGATIFAYRVQDPERYGVVEFDENGKAVSLVEKPENPPSNYAVTGLYFYDGRAAEFAKTLTPSKREELEITSLNKIYLSNGELSVQKFDGGTTWLDTGTHRSLFRAAQFVSVLEERQGRRICCPEEIAFKKGWIDRAKLNILIKALGSGGYAAYLKTL